MLNDHCSIQVFHRVHVNSLAEAADARFEFFKTKVCWLWTIYIVLVVYKDCF